MGPGPEITAEAVRDAMLALGSQGGLADIPIPTPPVEASPREGGALPPSVISDIRNKPQGSGTGEEPPPAPA